jgi:hypothetical protein
VGKILTAVDEILAIHRSTLKLALLEPVITWQNCISLYKDHRIPTGVNQHPTQHTIAIYLWSKLVCLFCLYRSGRPNRDGSDRVLGLFGKLSTRRGAWAWFHGVWTSVGCFPGSSGNHRFQFASFSVCTLSGFRGSEPFSFFLSLLCGSMTKVPKIVYHLKWPLVTLKNSQICL